MPGVRAAAPPEEGLSLTPLKQRHAEELTMVSGDKERYGFKPASISICNEHMLMIAVF